MANNEATQAESDSQAAEPRLAAIHAANAVDQMAGAAVEAPAETCPKCQSTTPWRASSWCPDCGYYPGVADGMSEVVEEEDEEQEELPQPAMMESWVVQTIALPMITLFAGIALNWYFTYYGGDRGLVALLLLVSGILLFVGAHLKTTLASMQNPDNTPFDVLAKPIEMWRPTLEGLPKTGNRIVCAVWGLTAIAVALFGIGGIDLASMLEREKVEEKEPDIVKRMIASAIVENAPLPEEDGKEKTMEEALDGVPGIIEELEEAKLAMLPNPNVPLTCFVYGYMEDGEADFGRLLLAAKVQGIRVHVGTIKAEDLPKQVRQSLNVRLKGLLTDKPSIASQYNGKWVRPSLGFKVEFDTWNGGGELVNPRIWVPPAPDADSK